MAHITKLCVTLSQSFVWQSLDWETTARTIASRGFTGAHTHSNITTFVISVVSSVNHLINWRVGDGVCSWSNAKLRVFFSVGPLACCESSVFHKLSYISGFCVTVFGKYLSSKYLKLVFRRNLNKEMWEFCVRGFGGLFSSRLSKLADLFESAPTISLSRYETFIAT